jgi:AcrR family transcriptional regulator
MTPQKPNKHEMKTKETRELLLRSAEQVFVRDGYEGAELGEIASLAGRTKGAIYAQFKSKEDIFMALVEDHAIRKRSEMLQALEGSTSIGQNRETFRNFIVGMSKDRAWNLLMLEFKLFAIRHPEAKKRFQDFMGTMISPTREKRLAQLLGPIPKGKKMPSRSLSVQMLQPLLSAVTLEASFDPDVVDEQAMEKVVGRLFDSLLLEPPSE